MNSNTIKFTSAIVGNLACQNNSYLKSFKTKVIECKTVTPVTKEKTTGKQEDGPQTYEVELQDTILFPEGGGQPSDKGEIIDENGQAIAVNYVKREGLIAKHLVDKPLSVGSKVEVRLDWSTRLDHMQQHTGQHLLSAALEKLYNLDTLSWKMASFSDLVNYLEISRKLTDQEIDAINDECVAKINENLPISVKLPDVFENESKESDAVSTKKIPKDYDLSKGILRVIHMGEPGDADAYDANPCCGTHLKSTLEINIITVLKNQQNVRGGNSKIFFLCGNLRNNRFSSYNYSILKECMASMSCQIDEISSKINSLNLQAKKNTTNIRRLTEELATFEIEKIEKLCTEKAKKDQLNQVEQESKLCNQVIFMHYPDKSFDFINFISKSLGQNFFKQKIDENSICLVLLAGEFSSDKSSNQGSLMIIGSQKSGDLGKKLIASKIFQNLKGGGAKSKWQGKISEFSKGELQSLEQWLKTVD